MNLTELETVFEELQHSLTGGWIQKIYQPLPNTLTFDIRVPGQTLTLLICIESRFARIHLASNKFENPPTPPRFCQFLRAQIEGGRIEEISQEPSDRVVYFTIATATDRYILVVALTGNHSNVYLLNESKKIMQGLKVSWLKIGDVYLPPNRNKLPFSPSPYPLPQGGEGKESALYQTSASHPSPQPSPLMGEGDSNKEFSIRFPVSADIEERYWKKEQEYILSQFRVTQLTRITKALKQANKKIKSLQEDLQKAEKYQEYGRYGELLKGQLPSLKKGQSSVTVVDYFDPALPELTLPLDSSKDPVWNMEDYFKKHHKYFSAQKHLKPRLEKTKQEYLRLQEELKKLKSGDEFLTNVTLPSSEKKKREPMPFEKKPKSQPARATGYRRFVSLDGLALFVGKTAKDNDALTFKIAGPDDLWLHARGTPGSHVVVRLEKGAELPHETLKDAATLALWFSDLRKSGKGEVIYTHRKFVKKAKGQKAGTVTVSREKSIWIEVKQERLERLKGTAN